MGVSVRRSGGATRIAITEAASVRIASDVHDALRVALSESRAVRLDLSGASSLDAAFAQLVVSARSSFESAAVDLQLTDPSGLVDRVFPGVGE